MAHDPATDRLFVACVANNSLEVIDIAAGRRAGGVPDLPEPQGVAVAGGSVFVATGRDGRLRRFDARTLAETGSAPVGDDADNVSATADGRTVWVSFGGAGPGGLASFDAATLAPGPVVRLPRMPEGFRLSPAGDLAFVNLPAGKRSPEDGTVAAVKLPGGEVVWERRLVGRAGNFPMALDPAAGRVFVATRRPAKLVVLGAADGAILGECDCPAESDDLFFDTQSGTVAVVGGGGPAGSAGPGANAALELFAVDASGRPKRVSATPLPPHARTGQIVPARRSVFVAAPGRTGMPAEVREYRLAD